MFFLSSKRDIWRQERNLRVLFKKVRRECSSVETQKCSQPQAEQVVMFLIFKIIIVRVLMIAIAIFKITIITIIARIITIITTISQYPGVCRCDPSVLPAWFGEILQQHGGFFFVNIVISLPTTIIVVVIIITTEIIIIITTILIVFQIYIIYTSIPASYISPIP